MSLRFHELAEARHRILNPFKPAQLDQLAGLCQLTREQEILDLCCGKGELLCQWATRFGLTGTGVDISPVFLKAAQERALELGCQEQVRFVEADAGAYPITKGGFDLVSCIGATWIGGGLVGTLAKMKPGLRNRESLLLVGEPYWSEPPPPEALAAISDGNPELFVSLAETERRFASLGLELIEMVLADKEGWDRYVAPQWRTLSDWLRAHPESPEAPEIRQLHERSRQEYLTYTRRYLGWGVFVLRPF